MEGNKIIDFNSMLHRYLYFEYVFSSDDKFEKWPWSTKIGLKQLQSVLYAFTGNNYDVETEKGRKKIRDAFEGGFGLANSYCNDVQIEQLKELLPVRYNYYSHFDREKPRVGVFYETLFHIVRAGYKYKTIFSGVLCAPKAFSILYDYKSNNIDKYITKHNDIFVEAMKIVLGENFKKTFTIGELIEFYNYPDISQDEINKYNDDNL